MPRTLVALLGLLAAWLFAWRWSAPRTSPLVVYCTHDWQFAEDVLGRFEERTGIALEVRTDTEATKSLGLVQALRAERDHPRCDVFWNNEPLGTMELAEEGCFEPCLGPGWQRMPDRWRDPQGRWTGFAGRLRVWIGVEGVVPQETAALAQRLQADPARAAIARPLYGTTRLHLTYLAATQGTGSTFAWWNELRSRGLVECAGNAMVKDRVAAEAADLGWTDSDDAFAAIDAGDAVFQEPWRDALGQVLVIPNTVAIVRGTRQRANAERLVEFLLSESTERALAASASRQIPLGPLDERPLDAKVQRMRALLDVAADLSQTLPAARAVLDRLGEPLSR